MRELYNRIWGHPKGKSSVPKPPETGVPFDHNLGLSLARVTKSLIEKGGGEYNFTVKCYEQEKEQTRVTLFLDE